MSSKNVNRPSRKKGNLVRSLIFKNVDDKLSISRLPEEILLHILSLMPTKFAVQTSILSKSWRYRWTLVTNLDFDDAYANLDFDYDRVMHRGMTNFVDHVLKFCKLSQVKLFRLRFLDIRVSRLSISRWIDEAVRLNVRELDVQVNMMEVPLSMFTWKTLTKLRLHIPHVLEFPCEVKLPCLKNLDIAVITNPFENAFKLIRGCPVLESLSLEVKRCESKDDYIFNIPTLKRLKLSIIECANVINKVVLNVPNVEYLFVGGVLCSLFVMKDVSSLVEASASFSEIKFDHLWVELVNRINGVKSLSVQMIPSTITLPCFPNMKHLKLISSWNSGPIFRLLESSPELKYVNIEKLTESPWIEPELVPACMLTNLTTVKFSISKWWKIDIPFLDYMLRNAEVLKTLRITPEYSSNIEEEKRLCAELLKFPRASRCCEISFN